MRTIELEVEAIQSTDLAIRILDLKENPVWIPKSQISDYVGEENNPETIFITEWLAEEKGLI